MYYHQSFIYNKIKKNNVYETRDLCAEWYGERVLLRG